MTSSKNLTRRSILAATGAATVLVAFSANRAHASDLPKLAEDDATALPLGYKIDATQVDVAKFPQRAGDANANNFCDNCALYTGAADSDYGPCSIFPGKAVAAKGWCVAWAKKT